MSDTGPQLNGIGVPDSSASWEAAGFDVQDNAASIGDLVVSLQTAPAWSFEPCVSHEIDGISCTGPAVAGPRSNPNGAYRVDHIVVTSPDLARTTGAFETAGIIRRKTRQIGERQQRFFWAGTTIIELVGPVEPESSEPAAIWGIALVSEDLDASKTHLGDLLSDPRDAVQPGRRIAAIRTRELDISVTIALMTPHVSSS